MFFDWGSESLLGEYFERSVLGGSRLYRRRVLRSSTRLKALGEIYNFHLLVACILEFLHTPRKVIAVYTRFFCFSGPEVLIFA